MGYGDWIMATGQAKEMNLANGRQVFVVGRGNRPQWSEVFEHNPRIARRRTFASQVLVNGSGMRPYIREKTATRWVWKRCRVPVGEIYLTPEERLFAEPHAGHVLIEPSTKVTDGNKAWAWHRWQRLVDSDRSGLRFIQCCPSAEGPWLDDVERVVTASFRMACAVLGASRAFVGTEGGLHHAAAALGVPAVVLYSEFIGPEITGYSSQRNIRHADGMCGARVPCSGCKASMEAIEVEEVEANLLEALGSAKAVEVAA
jgi:hypothetical protein